MWYKKQSKFDIMKNLVKLVIIDIRNYDLNYMSVGSNVTHEMEFPGQSHKII